MNATTSRGLRAVVVVMLLTITATLGLTARTQDKAYALGPAVVFLAPTVGRTIIAPVAKAACGTACRGALVAGAAAIPEFFCSFVFDTCTMPWTQNPNVAPNDDAANDPARPSGRWYSFATSTYGPYDARCTAYGTASYCIAGTGSSVTVTTTEPIVWTWGASGNRMRIDCVTGSAVYVSGNGPAYNGDTGRTSTWSGSCPSGVNFAGARIEYNTTAGIVSYSVTSPGAPTIVGNTNGNPTRTSQAYKRCEDAAGAAVIVWGGVMTYVETDVTRHAELPACPSTHPIPNGGGVVVGNPWDPGTVTGTLGTATTLTPDVKVTPDLLPKRPIYPQPQSPRKVNPTAPGEAPGEGLPTIDPATGAPVLNPDGSPKTQPKPAPGPDGRYCMWGGYVVPWADCEGDGAESDAPHDPETGAEPYPRPKPEDDPEGCMSSSVTLNPITWVFAPVKCALTWAFALSPETRTKWATAADLAADKPPVGLVGALPAFGVGFTGLGQSCPNWNVKVGNLSQSIVCGQGYTERLHDWRNLTGAALLALAVMPFLWRVWHAGIPVLNVQPHR